MDNKLDEIKNNIGVVINDLQYLRGKPVEQLLDIRKKFVLESE